MPLCPGPDYPWGCQTQGTFLGNNFLEGHGKVQEIFSTWEQSRAKSEGAQESQAVFSALLVVQSSEQKLRLVLSALELASNIAFE